MKNVLYQNIKGTSSSDVAIKLDCSESFACQDIMLQNINLNYGEKKAQALCNNVKFNNIGTVTPSCPAWEQGISDINRFYAITVQKYAQYTDIHILKHVNIFVTILYIHVSIHNVNTEAANQKTIKLDLLFLIVVGSGGLILF